MMIMMIMMMLTNPCNSDRDSQEGELGSSALESRGKDPTCGETSNLYGIVCFIRSTRGWVTIPKRMNLQKSFKRPLTPPTPTLIFGFDHVAFFLQFHAQKLYLQNVQHKFLDWKWPPPCNFSENSSVFVYRHLSLNTTIFFKWFGWGKNG